MPCSVHVLGENGLAILLLTNPCISKNSKNNSASGSMFVNAHFLKQNEANAAPAALIVSQISVFGFHSLDDDCCSARINPKHKH